MSQSFCVTSRGLPHRGRLAARALAALLSAILGAGCAADAAEPVAVRIGALAYGTVNWELDVIRHHGFDTRYGIALDVVPMSGKNANAVALQAGAVDVIVTDWFWVSRRRSDGEDYTFVPHSVAAGGVMVRPDAGITRIADLAGKKIGVAGGPVDKSWLLLRAYAQRHAGMDLAAVAEPAFAAPPVLNKLMLGGDLPVALNFWHYTARLKAAGMQELIAVDDLLRGLGVEAAMPLIGWVFSESWSRDNPEAIAGFLRASLEAKQVLAASDAEWDRIRPLTKAGDEATFLALRAGYRAGIPVAYSGADAATAAAVFDVLAEVGGSDLVGTQTGLAPGTFWPGFGF